MKFAICDDLLSDRQIIAKHLTEYAAKNNMIFELSFFESGEALLVALKKKSFQVIFLDIYMLALTGIDTAEEIRKFDKEVQILFVTTSPDHAISSYDVRALHYLMKPVSYASIEKVLNLCRLEMTKTSQEIEVLSGKNLLSIKLSEILYAEIFKKILSIYTSYGTIESHTSLEQFTALVGGLPFLQCHRSFVVNMDFVSDAEEDAFLLTNGAHVPISRPAKTYSLKTYHEYVFQTMRKNLC